LLRDRGWDTPEAEWLLSALEEILQEMLQHRQMIIQKIDDGLDPKAEA